MGSAKLTSMHSLWIGGFLLLSLCLTFFLAPAGIQAAETEQERVAKLVDGAKKEGKLSWYSTLNLVLCDKFIKRFQEKYPFITPELYRMGDERMLTKVLTETRAKRYLADVQEITGVPGELLRRRNLFTKYLSPERRFFPESAKDTEGYWTDYYQSLNVLGYNTKLVSPRDIPQTYEQLLDPKWKGKIGMDDKAFLWFAAMLRTMGEENGLKYMRKLAEQHIQFRTGRTLVAQLVAAGEVSIGIALYHFRMDEMKMKGAPIEWVPLDPAVPEIHPLSIYTNAPHPNAARLFVDFILSREGQEMVAKDYRIPTRMDVETVMPKSKKGFTIVPFDKGIADDYDKYVKLYRTVLMKK